jgi:hypothetical protein
MRAHAFPGGGRGDVGLRGAPTWPRLLRLRRARGHEAEVTASLLGVEAGLEVLSGGLRGFAVLSHTYDLKLEQGPRQQAGPHAPA